MSNFCCWYAHFSYLFVLQTLTVPWLRIFTSMPVWAIVVANITSDWGAYTLLTNIPTYINEVLKFDITSVSKCLAVLLFFVCVAKILFLFCFVL